MFGSRTKAYVEGARVYNDADITVPDSVSTLINFNQERYDTDNIHDLVTNNTRLTCKTAGKYVISGTFVFNIVSPNKCLIVFKLNSVTPIAASNGYKSDAGWEHLTLSTIFQLAINDYIEAVAYQSSGAVGYVMYEEATSPEFMMQRIG